MWELLTNAWGGWQSYMKHGKVAALLLLAILFLWFRREKEKNKEILIYATLITILCIVPVSAAALMLYQTRFYDYQWIWSYVPVNILIAYGGTVFLIGQWECYKQWWKRVGITAGMLVIMLLCSGLGDAFYDAGTQGREREEAQIVLEQLSEMTEGQSVCLWAPKKLMASARAYDGEITLIYGRNMWDAALGAYSYDVYGKQEESLYLWMCNAEETGALDYEPEVSEQTEIVAESDNGNGVLYGAECMQAAKEAGVNCILLPGQMQPEALQELSAVLSLQPVPLGEYYLFVLE